MIPKTAGANRVWYANAGMFVQPGEDPEAIAASTQALVEEQAAAAGTGAALGGPVEDAVSAVEEFIMP